MSFFSNPWRSASTVRPAPACHPSGRTRQPSEPAPAATSSDVDWLGSRIAAALVYDTSTVGLPTGIRAVQLESSRSLLFQADEYEVLVRIAAHRDATDVDVIGQVLYEGLPVADVPVGLATAPDALVGQTDRGGRFQLTRGSEMQLQLQMAVADGVLELPPLALAPVVVAQ